MKNIACAIGFGILLPSAAFAQTGAGTLSHADAGTMRLAGGAGAAIAAVRGAVLTDGDHVQTANGRAEITLAGGTLIHLDQHARVILRGDRAHPFGEVAPGRLLQPVHEGALLLAIVGRHRGPPQIQRRDFAL